MLHQHDGMGCKKNFKQYAQIFDELYIVDNIIMRGQQINVSQSLRADVIGLAYEGHHGPSKILQLLRQTC